MPTYSADYTVELTLGDLLLPQYDFDTRLSWPGLNNRCIVYPVYVKNLNVYVRVEYTFIIYDTVNNVYLPEGSPIYSDLIFGLAQIGEYTHLCVRSISGIDYGNVQFHPAMATYNQDGTLRANASTGWGGWWETVPVNAEWNALFLYGEGSIGLHRQSIASCATMHTNLVYDENRSIYQLEEIPQGSIVGGTIVGPLEVIMPLAVNGVTIIDYEYGDTSGPGGGTGGSFDITSDAVDFASLPTGGAAASGLVTMFAPTSAQLADFSNFLWANLFDATYDSFLTSLKKWVNDPIESVIQLACFPVTPPSGSAQTLKFCGIASDLVGSGVSMNKCTNQFMDFDFGSINTPAFWKQALDYSPYTQVSIYLPYIGICPLKSDDVIDATLQLKYHIDLLTGGFSAELKCTKNINGTSLNSVLYNWSGNMATQIPITSSNFSQVFGSMMTAVAAIGVGAISGGLGAAAGGAAAEGASVGAGSAMLSGAGQGLAANIGNVINSKPHVTQSGRLDGTVGALSQFTPYLIIERPVQSLSSKFQEEQGYPSNIVQKLETLKGMTVCEAPIMDGFSGVNDDELREIKSILCSGVIL